ncbi:MAG: DUF4469 domain-containing protein [Treponematales bacterium]
MTDEDELETIESVNILRAIPHDTRLPGVPEGWFTLRHELVGAVDREALTRFMRESGWSAEDARRGWDFHDALMRKMYESVLAGYAVDDGWARWSVGLSGTVPAERVLVHDAVASNAPALRVVADALSETQDTLYIGRMAELRGDHLVIAGPDAGAVGVFFTPEGGGQAVHIPGADCKPNEPATVRFVVPAAVTAGQYRVSLATRWTKHKNKFTDEARTSVYGRVVTVSAAP